MCPGVTRSSGSRARRHRGEDGVGPLARRDAGGDAVARVDADREGGPAGRAVLVGHHRQAQGGHLLLGERQADEPAALAGHEVDRLGRDQVGGHGQVALVLAILVVDHDDHAAGADLGDGLVDAAGGGWRDQTTRRDLPLAAIHTLGSRSRRAQLAPEQPGDVLGDQVRLQVDARAHRQRAQVGHRQGVGDEGHREGARRRRWLTVRLTPSTAIEPLGARKARSPAGAAISSSRASPSRRDRASCPTPSTWPATRWPPSGSPMRSGRSRWTRSPARRSPRVVQRQRLGAEVGLEAAPAAGDHGQADAVDRDVAAEGHRVRAAARSRPRRSAAACARHDASILPIASTIPVNKRVLRSRRRAGDLPTGEHVGGDRSISPANRTHLERAQAQRRRPRAARARRRDSGTPRPAGAARRRAPPDRPGGRR